MPEPSGALYSDDDLATRLVAGDGAALAYIYDQWGAQALALAHRLTRDPTAAEDIVQDVFLALWTHPDHYNPMRGSVRTWLLSTVHHRCIDRFRRILAHPQVSLDASVAPATGNHAEPLALLDVLAAERDDPAEAAEWAEATEWLRERITCLPPAQQEPLLLAYAGGMTQAQIAHHLGVPLGTIKTRLRLALDKLRVAFALYETVPLPAAIPRYGTRQHERRK